MCYVWLVFLIAAFSTVIYGTTEENPKKIMLYEAILKDQSKTTWMNCNFNVNNTSCAWFLGPLSKTMTSDDPPDPLARHLVEISNTSDNCVLRINDINFGDEGFYECILDKDPPKYVWHLVVQGNPGPPVIFYANGTIVGDDMIAVDEIPTTISLRCVSTGAKPKHSKIYWLIDGNEVTDSKTIMTGPIAGLWEAATELTVSFNESEESEFSVKSVTCVTEHATEDAKTTKMFGKRNLNETLHLTYHERMNRERGRLECNTDMFPRPSRFEILRVVGNTTEENFLHLGRNMYVTQTGRYMCRAKVEIVRTSKGDEETFTWLESNILEAEGTTDWEGLSSAPTLTASTRFIRRILEPCLVVTSLLIVNWSTNVV